MMGKMALRLSTITLVALLAACGAPSVTNLGGGGPVGDDDDDGTTPDPNPESFSLALSSPDPAFLEMNVTYAVEFTVTGENGFTGDVTVTATNLPDGVKADSVVVAVAGEEPVAGTLVLDSTDYGNLVPGSYSSPTLEAVAGTLSDSDFLPIDIVPTLLLNTKDIGNATAADDYFGAVAVGPDAEGVKVHLGNADKITIIWTNTSGIQHRIHRGTETQAVVNGTSDSNGLVEGVPHSDNGEGQPDASWSRVFAPADRTATTVVNFYCHLHGEANMPGKVTIVP